jgi:predicted DNA binding CopG/RHH family protein
MARLRFSKLDRVQRDRMIAAIRAGESVTAIAAAFKVSRRTVYNYKAQAEEVELLSRTAVLTVRLNKADLSALDELAAKHGVSRADLARTVLLRSVDVFQAEPKETEAILRLTQQLQGFGTNLNQIARAVNYASARGTLSLDEATKSLLRDVEKKTGEVIQFASKAKRVMVQLARLQRATNERIFSTLEAPAAPERPVEAPAAPERPVEAPTAAERVEQRRKRLQRAQQMRLKL